MLASMVFLAALCNLAANTFILSLKSSHVSLFHYVSSPAFLRVREASMPQRRGTFVCLGHGMKQYAFVVEGVGL